MTALTKYVGNGGILVLFALFAAVSSNAEQRNTSMDSQNRGCRISKGKADQVASVLAEVAELAADQERREIRETVNDLTNQTSSVNLGTREMQRIRTWLRSHRAQPTGSLEKADYLLVTLGDTNELLRVLTTLRSGPLLSRLDVPERLSQSEQPLVIASLSKDLFIEEPVHPVENGKPEIRIDPPSVTATRIVTSILAASPSFTDETRSWANGLLQLTLEKRRDILRSWWKKNEQHFASGEVALVVPLSEGESSIKAEDYLPKRRPVRKIE